MDLLAVRGLALKGQVLHLGAQILDDLHHLGLAHPLLASSLGGVSLRLVSAQLEAQIVPGAVLRLQVLGQQHRQRQRAHGLQASFEEFGVGLARIRHMSFADAPEGKHDQAMVRIALLHALADRPSAVARIGDDDLLVAQALVLAEVDDGVRGGRGHVLLAESDLDLAHGDLAWKGHAHLLGQVLRLAEVGSMDLHHELVAVRAGAGIAVLLADLSDPDPELWNGHPGWDHLAKGGKFRLALCFVQNSCCFDA